MVLKFKKKAKNVNFLSFWNFSRHSKSVDKNKSKITFITLTIFGLFVILKGLALIARFGLKFLQARINYAIKQMRITHMFFIENSLIEINRKLNQNCLYHKTLRYLSITKMTLIKEQIKTSLNQLKIHYDDEKQFQDYKKRSNNLIEILSNIERFTLQRENRFCSGTVDQSTEGSYEYIDAQHQQIVTLLENAVKNTDQVQVTLMEDNAKRMHSTVVNALKSEVDPSFKPNKEAAQKLEISIEEFEEKISNEEAWAQYVDSMPYIPNIPEQRKLTLVEWFVTNAKDLMNQFNIVKILRNSNQRQKIIQTFYYVTLILSIFLTIIATFIKSEMLVEQIIDSINAFLHSIANYILRKDELENVCQKYLTVYKFVDCKELDKMPNKDQPEEYTNAKINLNAAKWNIIKQSSILFAWITTELLLQGIIFFIKSSITNIVASSMGMIQAAIEVYKLYQLYQKRDKVERKIIQEQNFLVIQEHLVDNAILYHQCVSTAFLIKSFQEFDTNQELDPFEDLDLKKQLHDLDGQDKKITVKQIQVIQKMQEENLSEFCEKFSYFCAQKLQDDQYDKLQILDNAKDELKAKYKSFYDKGYISELHIVNKDNYGDEVMLKSIGYKKLFRFGENSSFESEYSLYVCRMCGGKVLIDVKIYEHEFEKELKSPAEAIFKFIEEKNLQKEIEDKDTYINVYSFSGRNPKDSKTRIFYLVTQSNNFDSKKTFEIPEGQKITDKDFQWRIYGLLFNTAIKGEAHIQPLYLPWDSKKKEFNKLLQRKEIGFKEEEFKKQCPDSPQDPEDESLQELSSNEKGNHNIKTSDAQQLVKILQKFTCAQMENTQTRCSFEKDNLLDSFKFKFLQKDPQLQKQGEFDKLQPKQKIKICSDESFGIKSSIRFRLKSQKQEKILVNENNFEKIWEENINTLLQSWINNQKIDQTPCSHYIQMQIPKDICHSLRFAFQEFKPLKTKLYQPLCDASTDKLKSIKTFYSMEVEKDFLIRILFRPKYDKSKNIDPLFNHDFSKSKFKNKKRARVVKAFYEFQKGFPGYFLLPNSDPLIHLKGNPGFKIAISFLVKPKIETGFVPIYPYPFQRIVSDPLEFFWNIGINRPKTGYFFQYRNLKNKKYNQINVPLQRATMLFERMSQQENLPTLYDFRENFDPQFGSTLVSEDIIQQNSDLVTQEFKNFLNHIDYSYKSEKKPTHFFFPAQLSNGNNYITCEQKTINYEEQLILMEKFVEPLETIPHQKIYYIELATPLAQKFQYANQINITPESENEDQFDNFKNWDSKLDQKVNEWTLMSYGFLPIFCKINSNSPQRNNYMKDFFLRRQVNIEIELNIDEYKSYDYLNYTYGVRIWARSEYRIPFQQKNICLNDQNQFK